jgi:hypothetical protein
LLVLVFVFLPTLVSHCVFLSSCQLGLVNFRTYCTALAPFITVDMAKTAYLEP